MEDKYKKNRLFVNKWLLINIIVDVEKTRTTVVIFLTANGQNPRWEAGPINKRMHKVWHNKEKNGCIVDDNHST